MFRACSILVLGTGPEALIPGSPSQLQCQGPAGPLSFFFFKILFFLFMRETQREAETQAEGGEAGSMQEPDAGLDPGTQDYILS